jgi:ferrous iron transport protein B
VRDRVVALAGNPNTGKSTVFNRLTGLRQHTGNWPGKTVTRAEGTFHHRGATYRVVDLPGTYSLLSTSADEEVARDFLVRGEADATVIVVDPACLERHLNLVLQVLEITDRVIVCLNLMDEARRHGLEVDAPRLERDLGVPVVATSARHGEGMAELVATIEDVAAGRREGRRRTPHGVSPTSDGETDELLREIFRDASELAGRAVRRSGEDPVRERERRVDRIVTSPRWGGLLMMLVLGVVMWITVAGANMPSALLDELLIQRGHPFLRELAAAAGAPGWLSGPLVDGAYLALAWVVSVMLPPMAIFFPLFTLLEDLGYLPRVAFNLDRAFERAGAHGKQALTMCMGFGCNAAGVVATRVIDSPRERLIAILTNNFALCNGRWPTQILIASIFVRPLVPEPWGAAAAATTVTGVALLGVALTFAVSWGLSRTLLKGEASTFSLELPPYRPPRLLQTIYTSLVDRTVHVLWRAMVFAAPAGLVIWLLANLHVGGVSVAEHLIAWLQPLGVLVGLNGIILLAYVVAIPANEIVIPTILMLTVLTVPAAVVSGAEAGVLFELDSRTATEAILRAGGWTLLTGVSLLLFSLVHNPCSTTLYTIWKETGSVRWTWIAALLPLGLGLAMCFFLAQGWRLIAG